MAVGICRSFLPILCLFVFGVAQAKNSDGCEGALSLSHLTADSGLIEIRKIWGLIEDYWATKLGREIPPSSLVLFHDAIYTPCGYMSGAFGPHYCSVDGKTYIDMEAWDRLTTQSRAPGVTTLVFALAHEYGHHLQKIWGVFDDVILTKLMLEDQHPVLSSHWSVLNEHWTDALAGHFIRYLRDSGRMTAEEVGLVQNAAIQMGDDTQYLLSYGEPRPAECLHSHGKGLNRLTWFMRGYNGKSWLEMNAFLDEKIMRQFSAEMRTEFRKPFIRLIAQPPF